MFTLGLNSKVIVFSPYDVCLYTRAHATRTFEREKKKPINHLQGATKIIKTYTAEKYRFLNDSSNEIPLLVLDGTL